MNPTYRAVEVAIGQLPQYLAEGWKIVGSPYVRTAAGYEATFVLVVKQN